jgi:site-specific recombinase XerD
MDLEEFEQELGFWELRLRNRGLSADTIRNYLAGCHLFARWCAAQGIDPDLTERNAEAFTVSILEAGRSTGTAGQRQFAIRQFSAYLATAVPPVIEADELRKLRPPKLTEKPVDALTAGEIAALLDDCAGRRFTDLRDTAIVRFLTSTGVRADEMLKMKTYDMQITAGSAVVLRGKGGKGRRVGFGPRTAESLARYQRARKKHPLAESDVFWLAYGRRVLSYDALYVGLRRRAERAGIMNMHPHRLRHSMAVEWLKAGGSELGLMHQGGWTNHAMIQRYVGAAGSELAIQEAHRIGFDNV